VIRRLLAVAWLLAFFLSCSHSGGGRESGHPERGIASSNWGQGHPCRFSIDCASPLLCRQGWCRSPSSRGEAWESCAYGVSDCRSGVCLNGLCAPNASAPADNGARCEHPSDCRSSFCDGNRCRPSSSYRAFAGGSCTYPTDCFTGSCQDHRCIGRQADLDNCLPVGSTVPPGRSFECCSGSARDGECVGVASPSCRDTGECADIAGFTCAPAGSDALYDSECCSLRRDRGKCVQDWRAKYLPCTEDAQCRGGFVCSRSRAICVPER
jgi:hypothetical protein